MAVTYVYDGCSGSQGNDNKTDGTDTLPTAVAQSDTVITAPSPDTTGNKTAKKAKKSTPAKVEGNIASLEIPVNPEGLSSTVRERASYTVSYNHDTRNPNWVAWVLTSTHTNGGVSRKSYDFRDDTDMPAPKGYKSDYYKSGYDRGHLCPAGDNKWSGAAMSDCFLMTNMCPQNASLNRGVWNNIEEQCRDWADRYGKLYIVSGPIYYSNEHRTIGGHGVAVPDAFFKVILCVEGTPKAIGFICGNHSQKGRKKTEFVESVDDVERATGYDFFSLLPDSVEDIVESTCSYSQW